MAQNQNPDLNTAGDGEDLSVTDARQGQTTGHMRWVLRIGTVLAVVALAVVWIAVRGFH